MRPKSRSMRKTPPFGDYGKEKDQEAIHSHGSFSAHPEPGATPTSLTQAKSEEVSKQPEEGQKNAKNSRKRGVSHKADNNLTVKKPGNQSQKNVEREKVVPPNSTLISSSEDTETQKETWGAEDYKPPWGWNPIPFPDDTSHLLGRKSRNQQVIRTRNRDLQRIIPTPKTSQ
jgi:hypothetical protein